MNDVGPVTVGTDPGWGPAWRAALRLYNPFRSKQKPLAGDRLTVARATFLAFGVALVAIGAVAPMIVCSCHDGGSPGFVALVVVYGAAAVAGVEWLGRRPLGCGSDTELASSYVSRFFLRMSIAQSAALMGFVAVTFTDRWTVYLIGFAFAMVAMARLAPTTASLQRDQEKLATAGCGISLLGALRAPYAPEPSE